MARTMRILSDTNVYHIVLKGINSEQIFYDEDDYISFLKVLKNSCLNYNASLYAFCIMSNHVHLLIKFNENNMPQMFKSFGASFVFRYNNKYNRSGSLFNGRYYSKAVNDDAYLLTVLKYIHFNPVNAKVCTNPNEWLWSSYSEYLFKNNIYTSTDFIFSMITMEQFLELHQVKDSDLIDFLVVENSIEKVSDNHIKNVVEKMKAFLSPLEIAIQLKRAKVPSYKISKLLGINRDDIYKM